MMEVNEAKGIDGFQTNGKLFHHVVWGWPPFLVENTIKSPHENERTVLRLIYNTQGEMLLRKKTDASGSRENFMRNFLKQKVQLRF